MQQLVRIFIDLVLSRRRKRGGEAKEDHTERKVLESQKIA